MFLLSICIPTYNRAKYLRVSLGRITQEDAFINTDDIEIVISDNASGDNTKEVVQEFINKFPNKIRYNRNDENIKDKNFPLVLSLANGEFLKLHNDTVYFRKGGLNKLLEIVKNNKDKNAIYFSNGDVGCEPKYIECKNANELYSIGHHWLTWNCGLCVNKEAFDKLEEPMRFSKYQWGQFDILLRLVKDSPAVLYDENIMYVQQVPKKLTFNGIEVFGENYIYVVKQLMNENILDSHALDDNFLKGILNKINIIGFDFKRQCKYNSGYFKYTIPYYWNKPYYYSEYLKNFLYKIYYSCLYLLYGRKNIISKNYTKFIDKKRWERKNKHNSVIMKDYSKQDVTIVGKNSSGVIDVYYYSDNPTEKLYIGNNVKIGKNVKFILSTANENETPKDNEFDEGKNREIIIPDDTIIPENSVIRANEKGEIDVSNI